MENLKYLPLLAIITKYAETLAAFNNMGPEAVQSFNGVIWPHVQAMWPHLDTIIKEVQKHPQLIARAVANYPQMKNFAGEIIAFLQTVDGPQQIMRT